MRRIIALVLAGLIVLLIGVVLYRTGPDIPDPGVLVVTLQGQLEEVPAVDPLARFTARGPALPTVLLQLEKATFDERIRGVLIHIRALQMSYAQIQELRDALARVRAADKSVVALLDLNSINATREIYLASAADRVYLTPGYLGPLSGIAGQFLFLGGLLDKLGVEMQYERIGKYKSAPEALAAREMSEPAREMMNDLLDGLYAQILAGLGSGRGLDAKTLAEIIDGAPSTADELVRAGIADGVADRDQALERAGLGEVEEITIDEYLHVDPRDLGLRNGPAVALIFGSGTIIQGGRGRGPFGEIFAADRVVSALEDATEDDDIRAIVLRVNSGGGSSLASEHLWRAVRDARKRKPVVVSMAGAAASGGYYVASAADAIVAEPATLTGSIGIYLQLRALTGLYEKLDVGAEVISRGRLAGLGADSRPLDETERERVRDFLDSLYAEFVARVSEGRGLSAERVDELGQGRVWLGEQARAVALVDELGGLYAAVVRAKREAGIDPEVDPARIVLPAPRSITEQIRDLSFGTMAEWLARDLVPLGIPEVVRGWARFADGEPAYLPSHWIELH
jgi:protease-4